MNALINQFINLRISYTTNHSINQSTNHSINQSINQSFNQSINPSFNQSTNHSINQPIIQSIDQPIIQPINQLIIQSINQPRCWAGPPMISTLTWAHLMATASRRRAWLECTVSWVGTQPSRTSWKKRPRNTGVFPLRFSWCS